MKYKLILLVLTLTLSGSVRAVDTWACAIWLCLPIGFAAPSCHKAKSEMVKRMFKGKSPVPSFESCQILSPTNTNRYSYVRNDSVLMGATIVGGVVTTPAVPIIEGQWCNHRETGPEEPLGCIATLQTVKVYENGQQMGLTYYRNKNGQDYVRNPLTDLLYPADNIPPEAVQGLYGSTGSNN